MICLFHPAGSNRSGLVSRHRALSSKTVLRKRVVYGYPLCRYRAFCLLESCPSSFFCTFLVTHCKCAWQRVFQRFSSSSLATLTMSNHLSSRVGPGHSFGDQTPPTGAKPFNGNQSWAIQEPDSLLLCSRQCAPSNIHPLSPCPVAMAKTTSSLQRYFSSQVRHPHMWKSLRVPNNNVRSCAFSSRVYLFHTLIHGDPTTLAFPAHKHVWKAKVSCLGSSPQHHAKIRKLAVPPCTRPLQIPYCGFRLGGFSGQTTIQDVRKEDVIRAEQKRGGQIFGCVSWLGCLIAFGVLCCGGSMWCALRLRFHEVLCIVQSSCMSELPHVGLNQRAQLVCCIVSNAWSS